jgi:hypothetical protein
VSTLLRHPAFDTEVFIDLIETIIATLPSLSPRRRAEEALVIVRPELTEGERSPIINLWEAMPATTRMKVEGMMRHAKPASVVAWLNGVAARLDRERPTQKLGGPLSSLRCFVSRMASIWSQLGLNPGLVYDFHLRGADDGVSSGGRVESGFQRYCRIALAAVGEVTKISARQVTNAKGF